MRSFHSFVAVPLIFFCMFSTASAQRHDVGSSPPTAPPPKPVVLPQVIVPNPANTGLGALEFSTVNVGVSAPQALADQLQSSDDRIRTSAISAIGAPSSYLDHGHSPFPRSVRLDFLPLSNTAELDAVLTIELDHHLLSAILIPENGEWHRVATVVYPTPLTKPDITPSTFFRADRALLDPPHYTAIFHATTNGSNGDLTENEAYLRILNGHAVVTISFASNERTCDPAHQRPCDITERWLQTDGLPPQHPLLLVTATGHFKPADSSDPIAHAEAFETAHLRTFTCQPFAFSDTTLHFEPVADAAPCIASRDSQHEQPVH